MESVVERGKRLIKEAMERGKVVGKKDLQFSPFATYVHTQVYQAIRKGAKAGGHGHLIGCTDQELRKALPRVQSNTLRWCRYSMVNGGYLKYSGFEREGSKVWVITDKPADIPHLHIEQRVDLSSCCLLSVVHEPDQPEYRYLVIDNGTIDYDGQFGELMVPVVCLQDVNCLVKGSVTYFRETTKVVVEGTYNGN